MGSTKDNLKEQNPSLFNWMLGANKLLLFLILGIPVLIGFGIHFGLRA
jgi:hypothetical protein